MNPATLQSQEIERPTGTEPTHLMVASRGVWTIALAGGVALALAAWPLYSDVSLWLAPVIVATTGVVAHMIAASRILPPFPHICILFSALQLIFMAWFAWYHPPANPIYDIGPATGDYLSYAAPLWLLYTIGWLLPLWNASSGVSQLVESRRLANNQLTRELDILVLGGLAISLLNSFVRIPSADFAFLLLANLRFVGAAGWLLVRAEGWPWRVCLVLLADIVVSSRQAMFGGLALWVAAFAVLFIYRRAISRKVVFASVAFMIAALPALEEAKFRLREKTWWGLHSYDPVFGMDLQPEGVKLPVVWLLYFAEGLYRTATFSLSEEHLERLSSRHNHGWIVSRVMNTVPDAESYAKGETLIGALTSALLPRALSRDKYKAGGEYFERFTQLSLYNSLTGERLASMNLGFSGELYANFGFSGGIIAAGLWGLTSGLLFRCFYNRALVCPLWWAFYPYVFCYGMKAEEGLGEILNWFVKAAIVAAAAICLLPVLRRELFHVKTNEDEIRS